MVQNLKTNKKKIQMQKKFLTVLTLTGLGFVLIIPQAKSLPKCSAMEQQCLDTINDCFKKTLDACRIQCRKVFKKECDDLFIARCTDGPNRCGGRTFRDKVCTAFGQTEKGAEAPSDCQKFWKQNLKPADLCKQSAESGKKYNECE